MVLAPCCKKASIGTGSGDPSGRIGAFAQEAKNDGNKAAAPAAADVFKKSRRSISSPPKANFKAQVQRLEPKSNLNLPIF
jgi:hypothetical protein